MAGVNGVNLGVDSIQNLAAVRSNPSVSADGTKSFENFLNNGASAQKSNTTTAKGSPDASNKLEQPVDYVKRNDLQSGNAKQADGMAQSVTEDAIADDGTMAELAQEIRDIVKKTLSVDDETVDGALEMMGISMMDLLDTSNLQQFVLLVDGGQETTDFLTNEGLLQDFMDLTAALEDFSEENADSLDSLTAMMEQLDTPVAFDEFLAQEGITEEEAGALLQQAQEDTERPVILKEAVAEETNTEQKQDVPEMVEKITVSHSLEQTVEQTTEDQSSQNSFFENDSEDASSFLYADREAEEPQQVAMPLFSDQLNGLQDDLSNLAKPEMNGAQRMQQMVDIVNQVTSQLRSSLSENVTTMEMQLNPENLGKVLFSVVSKAGVMTATFQVQSEEAKQALESQMFELRETLESKNLKVESVDVQISDFDFTQSNEAEAQNQRQNEAARQGRRKFRFDTAEETEESVETVKESSAEAVRRQVMRDTGGSVDFTA